MGLVQQLSVDLSLLVLYTVTVAAVQFVRTEVVWGYCASVYSVQGCEPIKNVSVNRRNHQ